MSFTEPPHSERRLSGIDFIIRRAADLYPARLAIDDRLRGRRLSYGELYSRSIRLARALTRLGVGKGDPVAYAFFNEHASLEAVFACSMIGAVAVPINGRLQPTEVGPYLRKHSCAVMMTNAELAHLADPAVSSTIVLRDAQGQAPHHALDYEALLAAESEQPLPAVVRWEDPYMMAMTGGTTGSPKAAVWSHGGAMMDALSVALHMGVRRGACSVCLAPTYHAAGLGWGVMPVLWQGGYLIMPPSATFSAAFLQDELRRSAVDYLLVVPALIEPLHDVWDGEPLRAGNVCVTSAPTTPAQRAKLALMFPDSELIAGYGMTETFSMTVQSPAEFLEMSLAVGEPSAASRVRIVNNDGRPVPVGTVGHIVGRTQGMCFGYDLDEENTRSTFRRLTDDSENLEWVFTGDIGFLDEEGRLTIVDRAKDVIISGGENVASVEVEAVVAVHPLVRECAAFGLPDERWGERVTVAIVTRDPASDLRGIGCEVIAQCRKQLAGYKVPKEIVFLDALPRTPFGKVVKRRLQSAEFLQRFNAAQLRERERSG